MTLFVGVPAVVAVVAASLAGSSGRSANAVAESDAHSGRATYYSLGDGGMGNCSFPTVPADHLYAALGPEDYAEAGGCGGYIDVTGPAGSVRVLAADKCPECESGHLDLSQEAFAAIGEPSAGIIPITYSGVRNPEGVGPLGVRVKEGSSQWWIGFLITNHGNPLASVEYQTTDGEWHALGRAVYNYWLKEDGAGPGPFTLRVTDIYQNVAVVEDISLSPTEDQTTEVWMYSDQDSSSRPTATSTTSTTATASSTSSTSEDGARTGSTCAADVSVKTMWPTGFQATVSITNVGVAAVSPWEASWVVPEDVTVTTGWNAEVSQRGTTVTATAPAWNTSLAPGTSVSIGFNASHPLSAGTAVPAVDGLIELNGAVCS